MLRRALLLKVISWLVFSPTLAVAAQLHCREDVRAAMRNAWMTASNGTANFEAAFIIREDTSIDYLGTTREYRQMHLPKIAPGTIAVFHTHPNDGKPGLSRTDKDFSDLHGVFVYVISIQGLYKYSHPTGQTKVAEGMDWENVCK